MHARHVRENDGWLAGPEKRLLVWIAGRLPPYVNSDHLTLVAFAAMGLCGAAFWAAGTHPWALVVVVGALALNWFGDSLDGTLARVRRCERPRYGFYVDHVLDVAAITIVVGGLALSGFITPVVAAWLLVAYLLVSAEVFLATAVHGRFRMSFLKFGPTELRIVLAAGALRLFWGASISPFGLGPFLLFDVGAVVAAVGLVAAFIASAAGNAVALYRAEPLR